MRTFIQYTEDYPSTLSIIRAEEPPVVESPIKQIEVDSDVDIDNKQIVNGMLVDI